MSIKSLVSALPGRVDPADAEIVFEGHKLRFRRPRVADTAPSDEQIRQITRNAPGLAVSEVMYVHLLAQCYLPDPSEGEVRAYAVFAELATANDIKFNELCNEWGRLFPEYVDFVSARLSAKNDSGAAQVSDGEPVSAPSDSEGSLESSTI